jgi:UDP-N-acetylmuramate--alanine ligase
MLNTVKKVHFIGIAGAGMRAIANVLLQKGYYISGSDVKQSAITERFSQQGARICIGQKPENLQDAELVVVSSAIHEDNVELQEAHIRHIPVIHRSDALLDIMSWGKGIAVAGAHGKTTTSSMLGQIFVEGGMDPTVVIGGEVDYLHANSVLGKGKYVIAEADESDGSFIKFNPYIAVVTNIDADHMDHYGSLDNVINAFKVFIQKLDPKEGMAVLCFDNEHIRNLAPSLNRRYISYGIENQADYTADHIHYEKGRLCFDVYHHDKKMGSMNLFVPGRHNVLNTLAAVAVADACGIPFEKIAEAMSHFHGAKRRFQTKGYVGDVWVVDDYGHHPAEINATLTAAKDIGTHRIVCVFQPHRYTRTQLLVDRFGGAFKNADLLIVTDIYSAGETPIPNVTGELIANKVIETTGQEVLYIPNKEDVVEYLRKFAQPKEMIITMGAGDIYRVGEQYIAESSGENTSTIDVKTKKIAVVVGGPSTEAAVSRNTGGAIAKALISKGYQVTVMELNPHMLAQQLLDEKIDIVFNALHGRYGEDGLIQGLCEMMGIPYTGSGVMASAVGMNKVMSKCAFQGAGIATAPFSYYFENQGLDTIAEDIAERFGFPVVIKSAGQGSSIGTVIVDLQTKVKSALVEAFKYGKSLIAESFINGDEFTVAVMDNMAFPVIQIVSSTGKYDYYSKYTPGVTKHLCPAPISEKLTKQMQDLAMKVFHLCHCNGVARVDFMTDAAGNPFVLEINTVPGMTSTSLVPDAARAMGISFEELCENILLEAAVGKF